MHPRITHSLGVLALVALCTSCAPTLYYHPTKGPREFAQDSASCQATAGQAAGFYDPYGIVRARVYPQCMYGQGWTKEQ